MSNLLQDDKNVALEVIQDKIIKNVESSVQFYVTCSIIQTMASFFGKDGLNLMKNALNQSLTALKKDCGKVSGINDPKILEQFDVEGLIDAVSAPYRMVLDKGLQILESENKNV